MNSYQSQAAIDARRGDYESARQAASDFFTALRAETDSGAASALSQMQRERVLPQLTRRDEIITLLPQISSLICMWPIVREPE
jgi:hypothetical protein